MKFLMPAARAVCLLLVSAVLAPAQITITASDMGAQFAPGHTITTKVDTATHTINIGAAGATSWDFSALVTNYTAAATLVRPDTTAFFSDFSTATHALKSGTIITYFALGSDLLLLGSGFSSPFDARITNTPARVQYDLPMTFGTSWTTTYAETTKVPSLSFTDVQNYTVTNVVDAYGTLTLPGGAAYPALRLTTDSRHGSGLSAFRLIEYQFITANGATVTVTPADTNQPSTGTISVSNATWNSPIVPTAVEEIPGNGLPAAFALSQNYPNPFNPSTVIRFSVDRESDVSLTVYNLLGEEVETLVSQRLAPGTYSARWDASSRASGVYMYRLRAGGSTATKALLLMR
jgi:hypothetical protein